MDEDMNIQPTALTGVYRIEPKVFADARGEFVKVYHRDLFLEKHLDFQTCESYYSVSRKNVLRGMHFQTPPADHAKLVYVSRGRILDVVLDIRAGSPTYGQYIALELSAENHAMVYISSGFAHGFLSLQDDTCVNYSQTSVYAPANDSGIHASSFGLDWGVVRPIVSDRDSSFPALVDFKSPFIYQKV